MSKKAPYHIRPLEGDAEIRMKKIFTGFKETGYIKVEEGGFIFPKTFVGFSEKYYNFKFRKDDVVVASFPKSGTTWTLELVWLMMNNIDVETANKVSIQVRSPFLEMDGLDPDGVSYPDESLLGAAFKKMCSGRTQSEGVNLCLAEAVSSPRTIKTHLPFSLLPPELLDTCKVVYAVRNVKDLAYSFWNHHKVWQEYGLVGTFNDFFKTFLKGEVEYGCVWSYLKEVWERRHHPNLHIIFFEDMKADIKKETQKLNKFLGKSYTDKQLDQIIEHASFDNMKKRDQMNCSAVNASLEQKQKEEQQKDQKQQTPNKDDSENPKNEKSFFRSGKSGGWRRHFTDEMEKEMDDWIRKHNEELKIPFKYD